MQTVAEFKAAFYDYQRQQANIMEGLVAEIVSLNGKLKEATEKTSKEEKKD